MFTASRIGPSVFFVCIFVLFKKIFEVPNPTMKRSGPAASCTTRASIATCTGCRVDAAMIPQPIVSCFVSRAISADATVEERASMPCLRHHGYASASQIVSRPASSIPRAEATISSSGSMVSCMTPIRKGGGNRLVLGRSGRPLGLGLVRLGGQRADALVRAARAGVRLGIRRALGGLAVVVQVARRGRRRVRSRLLGARRAAAAAGRVAGLARAIGRRLLHLLVERRQDVLHL